jgi:hypothetical protein
MGGASGMHAEAGSLSALPALDESEERSTRVEHCP